MKEKTHISRSQYLLIVFMYVFANDLIRGIYAKDLKNNLWLTVILGVIGGVLVYFVYTMLYRNVVDKDFGDTVTHVVGKVVCYILFILYSLYFIVLVFFNLRDIYEVVNIYLVQEVKLLWFAFLVLSLLFYIIAKGIEVFSRLTTMLFYVTIVIFVSFSTLIISFNKINVNYIFPIMEYGFGQLIKPALKMSYAIPFGELFALLGIYQYVKQKEYHYRYGVYGLIMAGAVLLIITLMNTVILGPIAMTLDIHPSLRISRRIEIAVFLQRFDIIVINVMMVLIIIKLTVLLTTTKYMISYVFKLKKPNIPVIVGLLVVFGICIFAPKNYILILDFRIKYIIKYANLIFEIIIPFLLILLSFFRRNQAKDLKAK
ncbi:MAG: endospore germination permease [Bacilli bacterium]|jgi:spore germination protein KB|nr:endospore germination permease [Bacilli bacterium]HHU24347.1 endospore germination permease [Acholeplasmataceae bacterium]